MRPLNVDYFKMNPLWRRVNDCLERYKLLETLISLEKYISRKNKSFPNPTYELIRGAKYFNINKNIIFTKQSIVGDFQKPLWVFQEFILVFSKVEKILDEDTKKGLVEYITERIKSPDQLRGFVFEIQMLFFLCVQAGFKLECIPEITDKKKVSPPDSVLSYKGNKFQGEYVTFSESIGCPIIRDAAVEFVNNLVSEPLYSEICPQSLYCQTKFTFNKSLVSTEGDNSYTPTTLLERFKSDVGSSNIEIIKDDKHFFAREIINANEALQTLSIDFNPSMINTNIIHQIKLNSLTENDYWQKIKNKIEGKIQKKLNNEYNYPLILCIELYVLHTNVEWQQMLAALCWKYKEKPFLCIFSGRIPSPYNDGRQTIMKGKPTLYIISKAMESHLNFLPAFFLKNKNL